MITHALEEFEIETLERGGVPRRMTVAGVKVSDKEIIRQVGGLLGVEYAHQFLENHRWRPCPHCQKLKDGPEKGLAITVEQIMETCPMFGKYK
jgi:hypothetical protein